jgi:uncharacterized protein with PIN domain/tRNA(Ser,Leu) C12 N-acetylase TAN1
VAYLVRLFEPGRDAQRRKERRALAEQLGARIPGVRIREAPGRLFVDGNDDAAAVELERLHGTVSYSSCRPCRLAELERGVVEVARAAASSGARTFRVRAKRVGAHPFTSTAKAAELGHAVAAAVPGLRVDLVRPDFVIGVEIRDDDCWVFDAVEPGLDRRPRPAPALPPGGRFLVDQMLGGLRTWLRLCGVDAAGTHDQADSDLLRRAEGEARILLTRDRELARTPGVHVRYVRATTTWAQLREVFAAFGLVLRRRDLTSRCTFCNLAVEPIARWEASGRAPERILRLYDELYVCRGCQRIYWRGDQYQRVLATVRDLVRD